MNNNKAYQKELSEIEQDSRRYYIKLEWRTKENEKADRF